MFTIHVNMSVVTCLTSGKPILNKRLIYSHCKTVDFKSKNKYAFIVGLSLPFRHNFLIEIIKYATFSFSANFLFPIVII